ncbi:MAG: HD domain-containing protein [Acidimicrobiia bacterium]|nr:HD domain-containing protein [Acidimicrobiia bacterium]
MSELLARDFLRSLFHVGQRLAVAGDEDRSVEDATTALEASCAALTISGREAVLSLVGDALYLDRRILPNVSTEFDSVLQAMKRRRIDTITILPSASRSDLADLAALVAGRSDDLPAGGTVLLNERVVSPSDLEMRPLSALRRTYADSLDSLRGVSRSRTLHLGEAQEVVDDFLAGGAGSGSSLLMATVHNHDELTYYHSVNVCLLALALGRFAGLGHEQLRVLGLSALLHDVGRVVVDEAALHHHGRLSNEDWAQVRMHPQEGAIAILAAAGPGQEVAAAVALEHHLRVDGGGYPDLGDRRTHIYSRIVAVVDTYEAVTAHRPYRPPRTPSDALQVLLQGAGTVHDADLVRLFIEMVGTYPPGSVVRLASGEIVVAASVEGGTRRGVVVTGIDGLPVREQRMIDFGPEQVVAQMLPAEAGVDPGSVLEAAEQSLAALR